MNQELAKVMEKKSSEDLFEYFKQDGHLNFEKRLIAGKILKERNFQKTLLKEEKKKIKNSILQLINQTKDHSLLEKSAKKETWKQTLAALLGGIGFLIFAISDYIKHGDSDTSEIYKIWFAVAYIVLISLYQITNHQRKVTKLMISKVDDSNLQKSRLQLIEEYWEF